MSTGYHKPTLSQRTNGAVRAPVRNGLFGKALTSSPRVLEELERASRQWKTMRFSLSPTPQLDGLFTGHLFPTHHELHPDPQLLHRGRRGSITPNEGLNLRNNIPLEIGRSPRSTPDKEPYPAYSRCILDRHPPDHEGHATNHPLLTGAIDTALVVIGWVPVGKSAP
jgi:hypothetical protein